MDWLTDEMQFQATRDLNSPRYNSGKRQMIGVKAFRGFNAVEGLVGAAATGFWIGGHIYCTFGD